jgi:hypothetical protein
MNVRLYSDETTKINLVEIVAALSALTPSISWTLGKAPFRIKGEYVSNPRTYDELARSVRKEIENDEIAFLFTDKPYDNNYFWDSPWSKEIIVSLYGWEHLTNLPRNNGAAYFCVALLVRFLGIGTSHRTSNTACVNDFWRDKTGVDLGMRAAFICPKCLATEGSRSPRKSTPFVPELKAILDDLSRASRANEDVCEYWRRSKPLSSTGAFDTFMCHNSLDKGAIRLLNKQLKKRGVRTWFDEEQLPPGRAWQELLERQIESIASVAVFVGPSGKGPWQDMEIRAFLSEFVSRRCPVIPVILKNCAAVPELPLFMRQFTWVDFRKTKPPPINQLVWGITGRKPLGKAAA